MPVGKRAAEHAANGAAQDAGHPTAADVISALFRLLERIAEGVDSTPSHVGFGGSFQERVLDNWPVSGHRRLIVPNRGQGGIVAVPAATWLDLLPSDTGRGGLSIVNTGANPCNIYLAAAGNAKNGGVPTGYAGANGGSFDGKISGELWCGPVSVYSQAGTTLALAVI